MRDGARTQYWLRRGPGIRPLARAGAGHRLEWGLVIKRHSKDWQSNSHGSYVEYDVLLADYNIVICNVAVLGRRFSDDSGDEAILVPATDTPDIADPTSAMVNILESDGDLVAVQYIAGRYPVIVGCINHIRSGADSAPWQATSTDGVRRGIHHKDTHALVHEDATVTLDLPDGKDVTVSVNGTQVLMASRSGVSSTVELGTGGEKLIKGDSRNTDLNVFLIALDTFVTALAALPGIGGPGGPAETFQAAIAAYQAQLPGHLSDISSTE